MFRKSQQDKLVKYENVFNATLDGLILLDVDMKIVDVNQAALSILNYGKEEMLGRDINDFHTDEYKEMCKNNVYSALAGSRACCDCPYIKSGKDTVFSDSVLSKLEIDGRDYVLISFHDISEQVELEESLKDKIEKLERINEILSGREEKIIELKKEKNEHEKKCGCGQ